MQVLLMVIFGIEELGHGFYLGSDRSKSTRGECRLVEISGNLGQPLLLVAVSVDARSILGAPVVALPHALGRIMALPEQREQIGVGHAIRMKDNPDNFGVACCSTAHLVVCWVLCVSSRVANLNTVTAHIHIPFQQPIFR